MEAFTSCCLAHLAMRDLNTASEAWNTQCDDHFDPKRRSDDGVSQRGTSVTSNTIAPHNAAKKSRRSDGRTSMGMGGASSRCWRWLGENWLERSGPCRPLTGAKPCSGPASPSEHVNPYPALACAMTYESETPFRGAWQLAALLVQELISRYCSRLGGWIESTYKS